MTLMHEELDLNQAVDVFWFYFGYSGLFTLLDDRMNAAAPPFGPGEVQSEFERRPHQRHAENTDQRRGAGKAGGRQGEAAAFLPEKIAPRRRNVLETEMRRECARRRRAHHCQTSGRPLGHQWPEDMGLLGDRMGS
jgi:hypothetical protein